VAPWLARHARRFEYSDIYKAMSENAQKAYAIDKEDYYVSWGQAVALVYSYPERLNTEALDSGFEEFDRAVSLAKSQGAPFNYYDLLVERADALFFAGGRGPKDVERAIADTREAINQSPRNTPWFLWTLGWAYYELGYYRKERDNSGLSLNALLQFRNPPDLVLKNIMANYIVLGWIDPAKKLAADFLTRNPDYNLDFEDRFPYRDGQRLLRWKSHLKAAGLSGKVKLPRGR
jgi:hypothetical protein